MFQVKCADARQNRERRVVNHNRTVRVGKCFVIAARVKWPHNFGGVNPVFVVGPLLHNLVNGWRRVAVIRGFFVLNFSTNSSYVLLFGNFFILLKMGMKKPRCAGIVVKRSINRNGERHLNRSPSIGIWQAWRSPASLRA